MRPLPSLLLATIATLGACSSDSTAPGKSPVGDYALRTVAGQPVPFQFAPDTTLEFGDTLVSTATMVAGAVNLRPGGRMEDEFEVAWDEYYTTNRFDHHTYSGGSYYVGRWEDAGAAVRAIADSAAYGGGAMTALPKPDTVMYAKAPGDELRWRFTSRHYGLGPEQPRVEYPSVYRKAP